jgi:hypothetical protein
VGEGEIAIASDAPRHRVVIVDLEGSGSLREIPLRVGDDPVVSWWMAPDGHTSCSAAEAPS